MAPQCLPLLIRKAKVARMCLVFFPKGQSLGSSRSRSRGKDSSSRGIVYVSYDKCGHGNVEQVNDSTKAIPHIRAISPVFLQKNSGGWDAIKCFPWEDPSHVTHTPPPPPPPMNHRWKRNNLSVAKVHKPKVMTDVTVPSISMSLRLEQSRDLSLQFLTKSSVPGMAWDPSGSQALNLPGSSQRLPPITAQLARAGHFKRWAARAWWKPWQEENVVCIWKVMWLIS